ncbi:MAG: class I SAM-dependent methyltransferase [Betaproteobacteria bacterium]|nr:class I SAM-dependent methyltransferase [Betaproteobacteria bacterium]
MAPPPLATREAVREQCFSDVWSRDLNDVFADVAPYYDRANEIAALGLWSRFLKRFMLSVDLAPKQKVLDVCAGTNAIGIALLTREPTLDVHAMDRSAAMQTVGQQRAAALGFQIKSTIGDVHKLPFPDNHFDVVTLQFASRHLRIREVFSEILRVLKPGGHFHHSDMLRPRNVIVKKLYYTYLKACLNFTSLIVGSGPAAVKCKQYFIDALELFYTAEELSIVLGELGYAEVTVDTVFYGMLGFHRAVKPG